MPARYSSVSLNNAFVVLLAARRDHTLAAISRNNGAQRRKKSEEGRDVSKCAKGEIRDVAVPSSSLVRRGVADEPEVQLPSMN